RGGRGAAPWLPAAGPAGRPGRARHRHRRAPGAGWRRPGGGHEAGRPLGARPAPVVIPKQTGPLPSAHTVHPTRGGRMVARLTIPLTIALACGVLAAQAWAATSRSVALRDNYLTLSSTSAP